MSGGWPSSRASMSTEKRDQKISACSTIKSLNHENAWWTINGRVTDDDDDDYDDEIDDDDDDKVVLVD